MDAKALSCALSFSASLSESVQISAFRASNYCGLVCLSLAFL